MSLPAHNFHSMKMKHSLNYAIFIIFTAVFLFSCGTTEKIPEITAESDFPSELELNEEDSVTVSENDTVIEEIQEEPPVIKTELLTVLFAGDIMDHKPNYLMDDFNDIYADIKTIVSSTDLSLANIEAPVDDKLPFSTYPTFNMKNSYVQAAIDAGFNVFSLANNHTNDQGLEGILETYSYFVNKEAETSGTDRPVYACGIKKAENDPPLTYKVIEVKGWKILFAAVTELLNAPSYKKYIDYLNPSEETRNLFIEQLVELRNNNPCDLFILSIHCCEPEYIRTVNQKQNVFYRKLLENGIDVVWANHPHVAKDWEIFGSKETGIQNKIIFNAMGNTISGQRWDPQFKAPETERDYTGDGYMIKVTFDKNDGISIQNVEPYLITTYITPSWTYVIKQLNDDFTDTLDNEKRTTWAKYLRERKKLMDKVKGIETWQ